MSFSFDLVAIKGDSDDDREDLRQALVAAADKARTESGSDAESETGQLLEAAVQTALRLAAAVARPEDRIAVTVTGHANVDHAPREGWADEYLTVTVNRIPG